VQVFSLSLRSMDEAMNMAAIAARAYTTYAWGLRAMARQRSPTGQCLFGRMVPEPHGIRQHHTLPADVHGRQCAPRVIPGSVDPHTGPL
jgi:hypothetical protein